MRHRFIPARLRFHFLLAALPPLIHLTGCAHWAQARAQVDLRLAGMRRTAAAAEQGERSRPARLERAGRFIESELGQDARQLDANARKGGQQFQDNIDRFQRRQPECLEETGRMLRGQPETLLLTAIRLFI
jgi:hypothetical protein